MMQSIQIQPIQEDQVEEARNVVIHVAKDIFQWEESIEEVSCMMGREGILSDLDDLTGEYTNKRGLFLVAVDNGHVVGTGGIRRFSDGVCELKRLWLLKLYHGKGIGFRLTTRLLEHARMQGFKLVRLETHPKQVRAIKFYEKLGFLRIPEPCDGDCDYIYEMEL